MFYIKKKKMYEMLQSIVDTELEIMKYASYKFNRGSEWLECTDCSNLKHYKLFHSKFYISLNTSKYDESTDTYIEIEREVFKLITSKLIQVYKRSDSSESKQAAVHRNNKKEVNIKI